MQKVVYSISKVNKDEKLKGVGYLIEGNLLGCKIQPRLQPFPEKPIISHNPKIYIVNAALRVMIFGIYLREIRFRLLTLRQTPPLRRVFLRARNIRRVDAKPNFR